MDRDDAKTNRTAPRTGGASTHSIADSSFGDNARILLGDVKLDLRCDWHQPASISRTHDSFLTKLSNFVPENEKSQIKRDNLEWYTEAFVDFFDEGERFDRWLTGESSQLLWILDDTGFGHSLLAAKMVDAFEYNARLQGFVASYFFYPQSEATTPTATDALAGLLYGLLDNPRYEKSVLPLIQKSFSRRINNIRNEAAGFAVLEDMFMKVIMCICEIMPTQQIVMVISGLDRCIHDKHGNSVSSIAGLMKSSARSHGNIKWVVTSQKSVADESMLQLSGLRLKTLNLPPISTAAALGLIGVLEKLSKVGSKLHAFYQSFNRTKISDDEFSWFYHCSAAISWSSPHGPMSSPENRVLWYRRKLSPHGATLPSRLGLQIASEDFPLGGQVCTKVYYSFGSLLPNGQTQVATPHPQDPVAQALWGIAAQLFVSTSRSESSKALILSSLSQTTRRELLDTFCSAFGPDSTTPRSSPTLRPGDTGMGSAGSVEANDWFQSIRPLSYSHVRMLTPLLESILQSACQQSDSVILVLDSVELIEPLDLRKVLHHLNGLGHDLRILVCVSDSMYATSDENGSWESLKYSWIDELTEYRECLKSLQFDSMHLRQYQIVDALAGTNQWLWANEEYLKWRDDGGLLWISGKAGSGKSVLAKTILQNFPRNNRDCMNPDPWSVCGWFYSARGISGGTQHDSMLRTLVFEIVKDNMAAFEAMRSKYRDLVNTCEGPVTWPLDVLKDILLLLSSSSSIPNTIAVIDAFDESEIENNLQRIRPKITTIFRQLIDISSGRIRIILLSRPDAEILRGIRNVHHISVQANNRKDISKIIDDGILQIRNAWSKFIADPDWEIYDTSEHSTSSEAVALTMTLPAEVEVEIDNIKEYLTSNASGVTLWVVLVLRDLQVQLQSQGYFTLSELRATLKALPVDLEDLYLYFRKTQQDQLSKNPKALSYSKKMLICILGSQLWAPLQLNELWEAIAILGPEQGLHLETSGMEINVSRETIASGRIQFGGNWERFYDLIYQNCGLLVEIHRPQDTPSVQAKSKFAHLGASADWTVQLAHETVTTFFPNREKSGDLFINVESAEMIVAAASYSYLGIPHPPRITRPEPGSGIPIRIDIPALMMSSVSRYLGYEPQCLALAEFFRIRPFARFALQVIHRSNPAASFLQILNEMDEEGLPAEDRFITHWVVDLCFTPTTPETCIRRFVCFCCLYGYDGIIAYIGDLTSKYGHIYKDSLLKATRRYEIVGGAIEALAEITTNNCSCFQAIANRLSKELDYITGSTQSFSDMENQYCFPLGPTCIAKGMKILQNILSRTGESRSDDPDSTCHCAVTFHEIRLPNRERKRVQQEKIIQALTKVLEWTTLLPRGARPQTLIDAPPPLDPFWGS